MITVTAATGAILRPALVLGYQWKLTSRSNVHQLISSYAPAVTVRPASLRSGTLRLLFLTEGEAATAQLVHSLGSVLTLADSDRPTAGMSYVLSGVLDTQLDTQTSKRWVVSVDYEEVRV
jgi:hypothetical protein